VNDNSTSPTLTAELLPCPFCGAALTRIHTETREDEPYWLMHPIIAGCPISVLSFPDREHNRSIWNRRASQALARPVLSGEVTEEMAAAALRKVDAIVAEGTSKSPTGFGPPFGGPWFIIDTTTAEPDVNWPGELIEQLDDNDEGQVGEALTRARASALCAALASQAHRHVNAGEKVGELINEAIKLAPSAGLFLEVKIRPVAPALKEKAP
jgi:hypothetical protein